MQGEDAGVVRFPEKRERIKHKKVPPEIKKYEYFILIN